MLLIVAVPRFRLRILDMESYSSCVKTECLCYRKLQLLVFRLSVFVIKSCSYSF